MPNLPNSRFVGLKATADGSLLRTATLYEKEYIVVPIISAVGDEVWWPANSDNPELVPADVLESAYWSRNNRPIVLGHPRLNGEYVSANSPGIIEDYAFGFTFASKFEDKRVKVEAWFDPIRANEIGPAAEKVISRLKNGEMIEVSEGNMVISEPKEGELGGKKYYSVWLSAINDHLAVVSEGACNNEMGCGGPRVNEQKLSIASSKEARVKESKSENRFKRIIGALSDTIKAAMSNNELRMKLYKVLSEAQQGVSYVYDEDVDKKEVIYCVIISYGDHWSDREYEYNFYRRSFNVTPEGVVSVNDDAIEVEWFEGWKDKGKETIEPELTAASTCSCQKGKETETVANVTTASNVNPTVNEAKKTLVKKLISASKGFIPEELSESLSALSEDKLNSMLSVYEGEVPTAPETVAPVNPPTNQTETSTSTLSPDQVVISKDELNDIKAAASAYRSQQEAHKSTLISSLKSAQTAFTEENLKKFDIPTLEKLAASLNINEPATVDYSVRGRAESKVASSTPTMRELPNTWGISN